MLGVCQRLEEATGIDKLVFQLIFVFWFLSDPTAFWVYLILGLFI
jgi:hypothetical protein